MSGGFGGCVFIGTSPLGASQPLRIAQHKSLGLASLQKSRFAWSISGLKQAGEIGKLDPNQRLNDAFYSRDFAFWLTSPSEVEQNRLRAAGGAASFVKGPRPGCPDLGLPRLLLD